MTLKREFPSLHHRKEGWLRHKEKWRAATEADADGVVFLVVLIRKTTPSARSADASRYFLLAQPPLLAVMQGGEYSCPATVLMIRTSYNAGNEMENSTLKLDFFSSSTDLGRPV